MKRKRMRQRRKPLPKITPAQELRQEQIRAIGCILCLLLGYRVWCEVHHLNQGGLHGGKRLGHDDTVGLCPWHHREDPGATTKRGMTELRGPSWAGGSKPFRQWLRDHGIGDGSDTALLAYQNRLIEESCPPCETC